ncbi:trifunctional dihydropteroate synthetase [Coemansia spiralis]|uniref:2-amino-4-hydroxy-6-hydroxymethyldihydropteridine diphosphokinase n=2 Tax=Coemansia TaxID=4863 RepID=A0A9W8G6P1_9FUNG|nr:Dihydropteroate synthase-like protein [Coemansia spiralis]KAJ1995330.1 trifunctional dihydropteroate synthetase [Coemansia umbellata]KAJ2624843.1 trifunctional dihydropteroate synthetase [Coemansia sp. RSA 1358]KAJ2674357.1 trifunctional dihydropteroate synthetase [Coemansia spiralis]
MANKFILGDLQVFTILGNDNREKEEHTPLLIAIELHTSVACISKGRKPSTTADYADVSRHIAAFAESDHKLHSAEAFADGVARECFSIASRVLAARVSIRILDTHFNAEQVGAEIFRTRKEVFGSWGPELDKDDSETDNEYAKRTELIAMERTLANECAGVLAREDHVVVRKLELSTSIGAYLWEQHCERTAVKIDLIFHVPKAPSIALADAHDEKPQGIDFCAVVDVVSELAEKTAYRTVDCMSTSIARIAIKQCGIPKVTVRIAKPKNAALTEYEATEITRTRNDFTEAPFPQSISGALHIPIEKIALGSLSIQAGLSNGKQSSNMHSAYIGMSANEGDRLGTIHRVLLHLKNDLPQSCLIETSFLYESPSIYDSDELPSLNTACLVKTKLEPLVLRDELQCIESKFNWEFVAENRGTNAISLEILFYDELHYDNDGITIPPPFMHERRSQLGPLCDLNRNLTHPKLGVTVGKLFGHLTSHGDSIDDIVQVTPLKARWHTRPNPYEGCILQSLHPGQQKETLFMGILNFLPNGINSVDYGNYLELVLQRAQDLFESGADIIDICGQPTYRGAVQVGIEEEIDSVVPLIKRIRDEGIEIPISVVTLYADVAAAALDAGADIINDVTGGYGDPKMLPLVAQRQCPYMIMSMDGYPHFMPSLKDYDEYGGDVVRGTRYELARRVRAALEKGVARWNIIIDPGLGFANHEAQNFEMLRRLRDLTARNIYPSTRIRDSSELNLSEQPKYELTENGHVVEKLSTNLVGYPVLVGTSRKRFIGNVTEKWDAEDRVWGTAATVSAAIQGGASIVRVHDIFEMLDVGRVSDCIYRR